MVTIVGGCDSYKSNESFSGKGHKNHLCKKYKEAGITKRPKFEPEHSDKNININDIQEALNKKKSREINGQYVVAEDWSEIEEILEMSLSDFDNGILQILELDDDIIDEESFYPSKFSRAFHELEQRTRELILLLPVIRMLQDSFQLIDDDIKEQDEDYGLFL